MPLCPFLPPSLNELGISEKVQNSLSKFTLLSLLTLLSLHLRIQNSDICPKCHERAIEGAATSTELCNPTVVKRRKLNSY